MVGIKKIWDRGIPLFEADLHFAPVHLVDEYRAIEAAMQPIPELSDHRSSQEAWEIISQRIGLLVARNDLRATMMDALLASLAAKKVVAYGFPAPAHPDEMPIQVPCAMFDNRFLDSRYHGLIGNGLEFTAVRVFHPEIVRPA